VPKNADELISRIERDEIAAVRGSPSAIGRFGRLVFSRLRGNIFLTRKIAIIKE
jgi:hypothetical protein